VSYDTQRWDSLCRRSTSSASRFWTNGASRRGDGQRRTTRRQTPPSIHRRTRATNDESDVRSPPGPTMIDDSMPIAIATWPSMPQVEVVPLSLTNHHHPHHHQELGSRRSWPTITIACNADDGNFPKDPKSHFMLLIGYPDHCHMLGLLHHLRRQSIRRHRYRGTIIIYPLIHLLSSTVRVQN